MPQRTCGLGDRTIEIPGTRDVALNTHEPEGPKREGTNISYKYFERHSIYHSDLRKVTEAGAGISFMVTSEPKLSKNKKDTIFLIQPYGDDDDYWYQAENDQIVEVLSAMPRDQWLIVKAHGDRGSAYLEITDVDGVALTLPLDQAVDKVPPTPPHQPTGVKPPAPPAQPPAPPSTSAQIEAPISDPGPHPVVPPGIKEVPDRRERMDELMLDCLLRSHEIVSRFAELHDEEPTDLVQRIGVSLFIEHT